MLAWNKHYIKNIHGIKLQKTKIKLKSFWKAFHFPLSNQSQPWLLPFCNSALSFMKPLTELLCHPYQPLRAKGFGLIYLYICFQSSWQLTKMVHSCALRDMLWPTDLNWFWLDRRNTSTDEPWRCWRLPSLHHYVKISTKGEDLYTRQAKFLPCAEKQGRLHLPQWTSAAPGTLRPFSKR